MTMIVITSKRILAIDLFGPAFDGFRSCGGTHCQNQAEDAD